MMGMALGKKRILVVCGTGVATSTVVVNKVAETCKKAGLQVEVLQGKAAEIPMFLSQGIDLIVSTTVLAKADIPVPVISGLPFLTGVGAAEVSKKIVDTLKS